VISRSTPGRLLRALRHLGVVAEIVGYALWLVIDGYIAFIWKGQLGLATPLTGALLTVVVLCRRRAAADTTHVAALAYGLSAMATLIGALAGVPSIAFAEQLALAVVTVAALRRASDRAALALCAASAVVIVAAPYLRDVGAVRPGFTVLSALGWGATVVIGLVLREAASRRNTQLADARAAERLELARELHDVVAHQVTGIVVAAQAAGVVVDRRIGDGAGSDPEVGRALAAIEAAGTDALAAMRRMVGVLRGQQQVEGARTPGAELGGIPEMLRRFDPDATRVRLLADPGFEHAVLPAGVAATGFRVVQEALTNVRRHAPDAAVVEVEIRLREEALMVGVRNDGVRPGGGAGVGGAGGFGLAGMTERVSALDGTLQAGPTAPGVWTVTARLPLAGHA
jgi:signal transduction histidine kinase